MNQILVTKKLYITPELKKKKKMYKIDFILSIFLVVALLGFYVYAEYDRNKSEEVSQDLEAKPTTKFKMAQDYIAMFISVDNHIMKEENHRAEKKLKALNEQIKRHDLNEKEGNTSEDQSFKPVSQSNFRPTMN